MLDTGRGLLRVRLQRARRGLGAPAFGHIHMDVRDDHGAGHQRVGLEAFATIDADVPNILAVIIDQVAPEGSATIGVAQAVDPEGEILDPGFFENNFGQVDDGGVGDTFSGA